MASPGFEASIGDRTEVSVRCDVATEPSFHLPILLCVESSTGLEMRRFELCCEDCRSKIHDKSLNSTKYNMFSYDQQQKPPHVENNNLYHHLAKWGIAVLSNYLHQKVHHLHLAQKIIIANKTNSSTQVSRKVNTTIIITFTTKWSKHVQYHARGFHVTWEL